MLFLEHIITVVNGKHLEAVVEREDLVLRQLDCATEVSDLTIAGYPLLGEACLLLL